MGARAGREWREIEGMRTPIGEIPNAADRLRHPTIVYTKPPATRKHESGTS